MSRSAGTLITTHNSTFIPPRFMPGYRGHCPTTKYDYGETYGNATNKYFQDYRSEVLNASHDPYARGGEFPTYYTHKPETVICARGRTRDRWLAAPKYSLSNIDFDRKEELKSFDRLGQKQRDYYVDKSGTKKSVDYFMIPSSAEDQIKRKSQFVGVECQTPNPEIEIDFDLPTPKPTSVIRYHLLEMPGCVLKSYHNYKFAVTMLALYASTWVIAHLHLSMILATRHTDDINLPYLEHEARRFPLLKRISTMSSQRDREMRDVYFEKR